MCPPDSTLVSTGERRLGGRAAKERTHVDPEIRGEADDDPLDHAREGDGADLLRPEREGGVLRGDGEGRVLRPEPAGVELRLPLETEAVWHEFHHRVRGYVRRRVR